MRDASYWINRLKLEKHPEGGYFKETYKSLEAINPCCLDGRFEDSRPVSTAIYFLLGKGEVSAFHRIRSDELWHHYDGSALTIHILSTEGEYRTLCLGNDPDQGAFPQAVVSAGAWFGATLNEETGFSLVGCTVAPGFDFKDFELGNRQALIRGYPKHRAIIDKLTVS